MRAYDGWWSDAVTSRVVRLSCTGAGEAAAPLWNDERVRSWTARFLRVVGPGIAAGCAFDAACTMPDASAAELRARIQGLADRGEFGPLGIS